MITISKVLQDDFIKLSQKYDFSELCGKSIFVTGATGLLGRQILQFLLYLNETKGFKTKLFGLVRSKEKAEKLFGSAYSKITFIIGDVINLPEIQFPIDYIIHGASVTSSISFVEKAVETIDIAVNGTKNLLELARSKNVSAFLYLSSMEAFGITDKKDVRETDLGYIDILNSRSSYSESKRMCECLCSSFVSEYNVPAKIIRLTQTLGTGIDYNDSRVAAQFARAVIEKHDIILKTKGVTKRPMLYTRDAIGAILTVLLKGKIGDVYTAANPNTYTTIKKTAKMIAKRIAENKIRVIYKIEGIPAEYATNLKLNLNLNVDKLCSLGWKPEVGLEESYRRMIESLKETIKIKTI